MIYEKQILNWRDYRPIGIQNLWKKINILYKDGWMASENEAKKLKDMPLMNPGMFKCVFVRPSVELTLEHLEKLTKTADFKDFAKMCDIKYDEELCKIPVKFKKFLREYLKAMLEPEATTPEEVVIEQVTAKPKPKAIVKPVTPKVVESKTKGSPKGDK